MEKFTTILTIGLFLTGALLARPAAAGCLQDLAPVEARARRDQDWLRRETALALLVEARRDAARGREAACVTALDHARLQLLGARN
jgi:hypothetical protein